MMELHECTIGARVKVPGGFPGTVKAISTRMRKHNILVEFADGSGRMYAPSELTKVEAVGMQSQVRPVP